MSDPERNKQAAAEYVDLAFNQGRPEEAVERTRGRCTSSTTRWPRTAQSLSSGS